MRSCLIVCHGYFGDHLFANSIAERLIEEGQYDAVDYVIGFPQVLPFLERNPYVRNVMVTTIGPNPQPPNNIDSYDKVFTLGPISRVVPPTIEMQLLCGVERPSSKFHIETNPELDKLVLDTYGEKTGMVLAIMNGWKERSFLYTKEQYDRGIDVPNLGYGGAHRNTDYIIDALEQRYSSIRVGPTGNVNQFSLDYDGPSLDLTASILKYCDVFIGAEGGLANLAYAVGTRTIITGDFVHQLYGPNGVLQKLEEPKIGPVHYGTGEVTHINLNPYLTDAEVVEQICTTLDNNFKHLKRFGVAGKQYLTAKDARGDTYTTSDDKFPPTNVACDDNPYKEELYASKYILDFGCGVGRNLPWIMNNTNAHYVGLDPNKTMTKFFWDVQTAEGHDIEKWKSRVTLINDFSELTDTIKFDYVVTTFVLQHLGYRHSVADGFNLTEITKNVFSKMNDGAIFFSIDHDSEEDWIPRWTKECNIKLDIYIRSYKGLPELNHRDYTARNGGHHLMIFKYKKEKEV